jgi:hypothetical protein
MKNMADLVCGPKDILEVEEDEVVPQHNDTQ